MNKQWNKDGLTRKKLENDFRIHEPFQVLEKNLSNLLARAFSKSSFLYHYQSLAILNEIKQTDTIGIEQSFILWQNENSPESNREITYLRNALYHKFSDWYQRLNHRIFRDSMSDLFLDMEKYNQMVVQDDDEPTDSIYKDKFRGKIQNNKVDIKFEPMFVLTYNEKQQEIRRSVHYYKTVDDINTKHLLPQKLIITNQEVPLNNAEIKEEFASIDKLTSEISANPKTTKYRFARAIDYYLLKDQTNAINDLNQLLTDNPRYYLGYFARAVVRWKQLDFEENDKIKDINGKVENTADIDTKNPAYNLIRDDLDRVVGLAPDFAYAYYNRGLLMCALKDYQSAMADFTQALQIDPKMGEAYFNRGLANAFNGDKDKGISDLSKAGELGVIEAYNVIKRLSR